MVHIFICISIAQSTDIISTWKFYLNFYICFPILQTPNRIHKWQNGWQTFQNQSSNSRTWKMYRLRYWMKTIKIQQDKHSLSSNWILFFSSSSNSFLCFFFFILNDIIMVSMTEWGNPPFPVSKNSSNERM